MLIPYNTDAPIYHFPWATIGLIVANCLLFLATAGSFADEESAQGVLWLTLQFDRINPFQWISNHFMHADWLHLIGNMFFLWGFGLVVEGKLGWKRFLMVYFGICLVDGALLQIFMYLFFPSEVVALGASGVIFGLLAIAVVWAPKNEMNCFLLMGYVTRRVDVSILVFCSIYLALQLVFFTLGGYSMSSEALHLMGMALGLPVGIVLLKKGLVNCEGWDLFNVLQGKEREGSEEAKAREAAEEARQKREEREQQQLSARKLLQQALVQDQPKLVVAIYDRNADLLGHGKRISPKELGGVIAAMHKVGMWDQSLPLIRDLMERVPQQEPAMRIRLAQILVAKQGRPKQAMAVLKKLPAQLPEKLATSRQALLAEAQKQIREGAVELDVHDW